MASPVVPAAPAANPVEASIDSAASARLASALASEVSPLAAAPTALAAGTPPAAESQPATPPAAAPVPDPAVAPAALSGGTPPAPVAPAVPETVLPLDPNALTPEAVRFLEMQGVLKDGKITAEGLSRALARGLDFNNWLGKKGQLKLVQMAEAAARGQVTPVPGSGTPGTPGAVPGTAPAAAAAPGADPAAAPVAEPPAPPAAPPAAPTPDDQQIHTQVLARVTEDAKAFVAQDQQCQSLVSEWRANTARLKAIDTSNPNLDGDVSYYSRRLQEPELDPITAQEYREKLHDLRSLVIERRQLKLDNSLKDQQFSAREDAFKAAAYRHHHQAISASAQQAAVQAESTQHQQQLMQAWPSTVSQVAQTNGIPPELIEDFSIRAAESGLALLQQGRVITDLNEFLNSEAIDFVATMDRFHRLKSGQYGQRAAALVAQTAPVAASPAFAAPAAQPTRPSHANNALADIEKAADMRMRQALG